MKRFVAAMASILALGFAGTAAAAGGPDARGEADPFSSFHGVTAPYSGLPGGVDGVVEDEKPRKSGSTQDRGAAKEAPTSDAQEAPAKDASPESSSEAPKPRTQQAEEAPAPAKADAKADAKAEGNEGRPAEVRPAQEENTNVEFFPGLPDGGHAAYGTGSVIHTDELQSSQSRLVNVDAAFAGASFSSDKLSANILSENARIVAPILDAGNAFGRGSGLEAGLNQDASGENQIQLPEKVEAKAPPSTELKTASVVPDAEVEPLVDAELLRGDAQALGNAACTTGVDLSFGLGHASDLGLVNMGEAERLVGTDNPQAPPAVSQSRAATRLVKQSGEPAADGIARFGLQTEVQQIIAPVTLFQGTPNQVTLNFLGTWTLRVTADGKEGSVFYGPGDVEPETIVLQVLQDGEELLGLRTQDLLGEDGLNVQLPEGLLEIAIGENPRAIGEPPDTESEPTETATVAAAAVDVVRVRLLDVGQAPSNLGVFSLGDLRVGHLEAAVQVPEGGIPCG
ncbi:MAG: hypothetical protein ACRDY7_07100, partial [Acidimicrobiia bacterium]